MADFSTSAELMLEVNRRSLRQARDEIEGALDDPTARLDVSGSGSGGSGGLDDLDDDLRELTDLAERRNQLLDDIVDCVCDNTRGGGGGGGGFRLPPFIINRRGGDGGGDGGEGEPEGEPDSQPDGSPGDEPSPDGEPLAPPPRRNPFGAPEPQPTPTDEPAPAPSPDPFGDTVVRRDPLSEPEIDPFDDPRGDTIGPNPFGRPEIDPTSGGDPTTQPDIIPDDISGPSPTEVLAGAAAGGLAAAEAARRGGSAAAGAIPGVGGSPLVQSATQEGPVRENIRRIFERVEGDRDGGREENQPPEQARGGGSAPATASISVNVNVAQQLSEARLGQLVGDRVREEVEREVSGVR